MRPLPTTAIALCLALFAVVAIAEPLTLLWRVPAGPRPLAPVVVAAGEALVVAEDGSVRRFSLGSGEFLGLTALGEPAAQVIADGERALVLSAAGSLWALRGDGTPGTEICLPASPSAAPVLAPGRILIPLADASLLALERATLGVAWRATLAHPAIATPAVTATTLVVADRAGEVRILRLADGAEIATGSAGGVVEQSPAIAGDVFFVGSPGERLHGLDAAKARTRFKALAGRGPSAGILGLGETAYVVTLSNELYAFKPSGTPRWRVGLPSRVLLALTVRGSTLVLVPHRGTQVLAYRLADGLMERLAALPDPLVWLTSEAVVADSLLLFTTSRDEVLAFGPAVAPTPAAAPTPVGAGAPTPLRPVGAGIPSGR